jgi:hypothetical protein
MMDETPEMAMNRAFLNEEAARRAMDGRLLMFASAALTIGGEPVHETMARQDAIMACSAYMDAVKATVNARIALMKRGHG